MSLYSCVFFKNVHRTSTKIQLEMNNALLVQRIQKVRREKGNVSANLISIALKDRTIRMRVTVSTLILYTHTLNFSQENIEY